MQVHGERDVLVGSSQGLITRVPVASITKQGRGAAGVRLMRLNDPLDSVMSVALLQKDVE